MHFTFKINHATLMNYKAISANARIMLQSILLHQDGELVVKREPIPTIELLEKLEVTLPTFLKVRKELEDKELLILQVLINGDIHERTESNYRGGGRKTLYNFNLSNLHSLDIISYS